MTRQERKAWRLQELAMGGIVVNGRVHYYDHLTNLKKISKGKYTVERHGTTWRIEGGRHLGGYRTDWFVDQEGSERYIKTTSLVDSLRLLENM